MRKRPWTILLSVTTAVVVGFSSTAMGQDTRPAPVEKPTVSIESGGCATDKCHPGVKAERFTHGPVSVDSCDACHGEVDPAEHTFELTRTGPQLCGFCHQLDLAGEHLHQPVAEGQCGQCHQPHGADNRFLLRGGGGAASCIQCHEDVTAGLPVAHGPVAAGACTACHRAHSSDYPKLLNASGSQLCLECHVAMSDRLDALRVLHGPVAADCTACHRPHASEHKMLLKTETTALCQECHPEIGELIANAEVKHTAVSTGKSCRNCHDPHGSDYQAMLITDEMDVCLTCHDREIELADGTTLTNMKAVLANAKNLHGPIAQRSCFGCHEVHGGARFRLLVREYPSAFYAPFRVENYALCFECHDRQLFLEATTAHMTNFRNGDQNLHYLHVNKDVKGRTCRACHETHASNRPRHMRESVPFGSGGWKLPINFQITETGGGCTPGCHRPYAYDRVNPVVNVAPRKPAAGPDATVTPGVKEVPKKKGSRP